jgi:predicted transcriptional regulator
MEDELSRTLKRLRNRVESARKVIPEDAIERERRQPTLSF